MIATATKTTTIKKYKIIGIIEGRVETHIDSTVKPLLRNA
jgi:hypothetical protein